MLENKEEKKICWLHKIVMKEIKKQNTDKEKEYKCPMCLSTMKEVTMKEE